MVTHLWELDTALGLSVRFCIRAQHGASGLGLDPTYTTCLTHGLSYPLSEPYFLHL